MLNTIQKFSFTLLGAVMFTSASSARESYTDMSLTCKYEAQINYGIARNSSKIFPIDQTYNGFTIFGQSPRNSERSLFYKCTFNTYGEFINVEKIADNRYNNNNNNNNESYQISQRAKRVCKGEASTRWRTSSRYIRINNTQKVGRNEFKVYLNQGNRKGICNVSNSGHIYGFETKTYNNHINNISLREAKNACTRRAASRWGVSSNRIRILSANRHVTNDYSIKMAFRSNRAHCEVSRRGRIYNFSEY